MPTDSSPPAGSGSSALEAATRAQPTHLIQVPVLSEDTPAPKVTFTYGPYAMTVTALGLPEHLCLDVHSTLHEQPCNTGVFGMSGGPSTDYDTTFIGRTQFPTHERGIRLPTSQGMPATGMVALLAGPQRSGVGPPPAPEVNRAQPTLAPDLVQSARGPAVHDIGQTSDGMFTQVLLADGNLRISEPDPAQHDKGRMHVLDVLGVSLTILERHDGIYVHIERDGDSPPSSTPHLIVVVDHGGETHYGVDTHG